MPAVTLYCLPFAGGNAFSYRPLEKVVAGQMKVVSLEPPGRGRRIQEQPVETLVEMARDVVAGIRDSLHRPYAFFGHSMGGLLAYLVTVMLAEESLPLPQHLFISGKGPPHIASRDAQWHRLPLPAFIDKLRELGGCPAAVLEDRDLMAYFAPLIQRDMRLVSEYRHRDAGPVEVPISVMIGSRESTTSAEAAQWTRFTSADCRILQFEGGHFFLFNHVQEIGGLLQETLAVA